LLFEIQIKYDDDDDDDDDDDEGIPAASVHLVRLVWPGFWSCDLDIYRMTSI